MPFVHQPLGVLVAKEPAKAHSQLVALFKEHGSLVAVASAIPVNGRTLARWLERLVKAGYSDPREDAHVWQRPTYGDEIRKSALKLQRKGLSPAQIANELGASYSTVVRWLAAS